MTKPFLDSFSNEDQAFEKYLNFNETHFLKKYEKTNPTSDGAYSLSD